MSNRKALQNLYTYLFTAAVKLVSLTKIVADLKKKHEPQLGCRLRNFNGDIESHKMEEVPSASWKRDTYVIIEHRSSWISDW